MVTDARKDEMYNSWKKESYEEWTTQWRDELTGEEAGIVELWDERLDKDELNPVRYIKEMEETWP